MSYLHPAYNRLLPPTARPQLVAFLQLVERNAHASADGWTDIRQEVIARELGRTVRNVQRYERICADAGILVVEHKQRHNRRRLTLRSAKEALASNPTPRLTPIREWRHACRHSDDTDVVTVDNSHLLPRARVSLEETSLTLRGRPSAAERAAPVQRDPKPAKAPDKPKVSEAVIRRCTSFCTPLGNRWAATVADLVFRLVRSQGEQLTLGYLDIVEQRTAGKVDPYERAKSVMAMLNARLRKHAERGTPRSRTA